MFDQRRVNKVSRRFSLLLFLWLVFQIQLAYIFSIACLWMSIGIITVEFLVIGVYSQCVFCWKHCLYLNCCFTIRNSISVWYFPFAFCETWLWTWRFDLNIHIKLQKTSETSKRFRALKAIYRLVQCNPLLKHRTICHHSSCSHKLDNETVHVYQVPSWKRHKPNFTRDKLKL